MSTSTPVGFDRLVFHWTQEASSLPATIRNRVLTNSHAALVTKKSIFARPALQTPLRHVSRSPLRSGSLTLQEVQLNEEQQLSALIDSIRSSISTSTDKQGCSPNAATPVPTRSASERGASVPAAQRIVFNSPEAVATTGRKSWRDIVFHTIERCTSLESTTFVVEDSEYSFEEICVKSVEENPNDKSLWRCLYECMEFTPKQEFVSIQGKTFSKDEVAKRCEF